MGSRAEIILAIKNKRSLPRNIHVGEDQTEMQRIRYKQLKDQVIDHNRDHSNNPRTIKYVNGNPVNIDINNVRSRHRKEN